jgi:SAM-dependent methyltransferase
MTSQWGNEIPWKFDILSGDSQVTQSTETHLFRYLLANHWTKDKDVLDLGCGYGYGSAYMKILGAKSVTGFDIDSEAIGYAKKNYPICDFHVKDLSKPIEGFDNKFDTIISIETLEHIPRHLINVYFDNIKRMLKENGTVVITTPQRITPIYAMPRREGIHSHLYEYSLEEFHTILGLEFNKYNVYGIQEVHMGQMNQLVSIFTTNARESRIMVAVIENVKKV